MLFRSIQVHGGYGYTRDFPVEQYWRDNRLNMIHEGTHGIQAQDLLGRKVRMNEGAALSALGEQVMFTAQRARVTSAWAEPAQALEQAWHKVLEATALAATQPDLVCPWLSPTCRVLGMWCWPGSGWMWR